MIADSIEPVARGHLLDGSVCLVGCDKTIPAAVMAAARLDLPGLVLYNGSIALPLPREGRDHPGRLRGRRRARRREDDRRGAARARGRRLSRRGRLRGQFTANTMSTALEFLGISPAGLNGIPALAPAKTEAAEQAGRLVEDLLRRDVRDRRR